MKSPERQTIELMAYYIYLAEGRPEGRAEQHWLEAEEQLEVECQFKAEASLEPNIFGDKAIEHLGDQDQESGVSTILVAV